MRVRYINDQTIYDLIVIGGGAAGFFGALACAESNPRLRILILEKAGAVLGKVRISGGGRCNLTHACFDPAELARFYPRGAQALHGAFTRFQPADTMRWFEAHGVKLKVESDGRVFPASDSAETVIACLMEAVNRSGIELRTRAPVAAVSPRPEGGFTVSLKGGESLACRSLLLTSGGERGGMELAASLGHRIVSPAPSLFTFKVDDPRLDGLQGVSVPDARLELLEARLQAHGPLLITHWGLSGPAVLRLSAWGARALFQANYHMALRVQWAAPERAALLADMRAAHGRRRLASHSPFEEIPLRLWQRLANAAGITEEQVWASLTRKQQQHLTRELTAGLYQIKGKGPFKEEFVTCGGVALNEVDFRSMQSRVAPGLFLAGEVLDIDGLTGGFNFQNAWTTAWIAGHAIGGNT